MRYVNRAEVPIPGALSLTDKVSEEKKKAKAYFEKKLKEAEALAKAAVEAQAEAAAAQPKAAGDKSSKKDKPFEFKLYKDATIKEALEKLFLGKCAYCENRYASIHPVDIEHWRPKAEVIIDEQENKRYGYYWLAASWENLLPSCIDCNRTRKHIDFLEKKETKVGKGNWFPLADDASRANAEGEESKEVPLLLNPCQDKPEEHLDFHEEGFIKPKLDNANQPSAKAKASIRCYALNRTELVLDRRERVLIIRQKMHIIERLADCLNAVNKDADLKDSDFAIIIEDLLSHELNLLNGFEHPSQPFSMMAKQMIENFMKTFKRPG